MRAGVKITYFDAGIALGRSEACIKGAASSKPERRFASRSTAMQPADLRSDEPRASAYSEKALKKQARLVKRRLLELGFDIGPQSKIQACFVCGSGLNDIDQLEPNVMSSAPAFDTVIVMRLSTFCLFSNLNKILQVASPVARLIVLQPPTHE